jgi:hypothetical protein
MLAFGGGAMFDVIEHRRFHFGSAPRQAVTVLRDAGFVKVKAFHTRETCAFGKHLANQPLTRGRRHYIGDQRAHEHVPVPLWPRHLKNSAESIMKYETDNPQTAPLLQAFAKALLTPKPKSAAGQPEPLSYCKCNMNSVVGDGVTVSWPAYTSRLDIEPELAVAYGRKAAGGRLLHLQ